MTKNLLSFQPLLLLILFGALVIGAAMALFSPVVAVGIVVSLAGVMAIFWDYRVGVTSAMCLAPISSANNILKMYAAIVVLSSLSFLLGRIRERKPYATLPKAFIFLYCIPYLIAFAAALMQIDIPYRAMKDPVNREIYTTYGYFVELFLPAASHVLLALLLANAVKISANKEYWLVLYCLSVMIASTTFMLALATSGYEITVLQRDRNIEMFYTHANDWGACFGSAAGILIFLSALAKGRLRFISMVATAFALVGLAFAFSRGGYLLFLVALFGFLLISRRLKLILGVGLVAVVASFILPEEVIERATTGLDPSTISAAEGGSMNDQLTAGRGGVFIRIIPEIFNSPVVGRGLGAMAFTDTYVSGRLNMTNPHNLYVETLLDTGAVGFLLFGVWAWKFLKACRRISSDESTPPSFSALFKGLGITFVGFLVNGATNGHWFPSREQSFLWMGFGMLLAFWNVQAQPLVDRNLSSARLGDVRNKLTGLPSRVWPK